MRPGSAERPLFSRPSAALPLIVGLLLAGGVRLWGAPLVEKVPADLSTELHLDSKTHFRPTLASPWQDILHIGQRTDRIVSTSGDAAIVQAGVAWSDEKGNEIYQTSGLYGVNRADGRNVTGLGDLNRTGQFLLPPFFDTKTFVIWDPYYSGPRDVDFLRIGHAGGVAVRVYRFVVHDLDETQAYSFMPDVPGRYSVMSSGEGEISVEPVSGLIVDFTDRGQDAFFDRASRRAAGVFLTWDARYSDSTRAAQLGRALARHRLILALRDWTPLSLIGAGMLAGLVVLLRRRQDSNVATLEPTG